MAVEIDDLSRIFREVIERQGARLYKESDIVIWFCHYLLSKNEKELRFRSESGKARYDLEIIQPNRDSIYCEFKYAWDGWQTSELKKDKDKLRKVLGKGTPCFFLAYKKIFHDRAVSLQKEFQAAKVNAVIVCANQEGVA